MVNKRNNLLISKINAIISRYEGESYSEVLSNFHLTPNQFTLAVTRDINNLIEYSNSEYNINILEKIKNERQVESDLFFMGEDFIKKQYYNINSKKQVSYFAGTYKNKDNINNLVYHTFSEYDSIFKTNNRTKIIKKMINFPKNLEVFFEKELGLRGVMLHGFTGSERTSPMPIIKSFDKKYQEKTTDSSLFDINSKEHLHPWDFKVPKAYWDNDNNLEYCIYHVLTDEYPILKTNNRKEIISTIKSMPISLAKHFFDLGLSSPMSEGYNKTFNSSPFKVLEIYDKKYQELSNHPSLFDINIKDHLHPWDFRSNMIRINKEDISTAIYHIITEKVDIKNTDSREETINKLNKHPINKTSYLYKIGLQKIMKSALDKEKKGNAKEVLSIFDKAYQEKTNNLSLFDTNQKNYL